MGKGITMFEVLLDMKNLKASPVYFVPNASRQSGSHGVDLGDVFYG
jgi:hypothetical protein